MSLHHTDSAIIIGVLTSPLIATAATWSLRDDLSIAVSVVTLVFYFVYFLSMWNNRKRP